MTLNMWLHDLVGDLPTDLAEGELLGDGGEICGGGGALDHSEGGAARVGWRRIGGRTGNRLPEQAVVMKVTRQSSGSIRNLELGTINVRVPSGKRRGRGLENRVFDLIPVL